MQRASRPEWGKWGLIGFSDGVHQIATKQKGTPTCMFLGHWLAVFDPMSLMLPLLLLILLASQQGNYSI